jgi:DNA (cytosine-5)-methyltransferase 1
MPREADAHAVPTRFTFAEFFAGIGGFRLALEAAGGRCVLTCEWNSFAQATYRRNWPDGHALVGDIRLLRAEQVPPHDIMAAGFPCQSFSSAGRVGAFDDERGQLFHELVRVAVRCRPRALLLENVRGLLTNRTLE